MAAWLKIWVAKWWSLGPALLVAFALAGGLALAYQGSAAALGADFQPGAAFTYDGTYQLQPNSVAERAISLRLVGPSNSADSAPAAGGHVYEPSVDLVAPGSLRTVGGGFSASESRVAQLLADRGNTIVLREATGVGRTSDLLVNSVRYDVYTPTTGNVNAIVSAVSKKGSQVQGGGVVIDLADSPLTTAQLGDILPRVQGVTSQISDIIVVGG